MLIPLCLAAYYQLYESSVNHPQAHGTMAFAGTIAICLIFAAIFYWMGRKTKGHLFRREGIALVVAIWVITPAISALPFIFSGTLTNPFMAYFEAASGLTTTGATVLQAKHYNAEGQEIPIEKSFGDPISISYSFYGTVSPIRDPQTHKILYEGIEAVGKAILFWRSFIQWIGGVGIVVLFVAIFPILGVSGKLLFQSEISGPVKDSSTPRVAQAAAQLWMIYLGLSFLQVIFLQLTNHQMSFFDSITITFSTLSTGGFSVRNDSIAAYKNSYTEWVIIIFMILGGANFSLYFQAIRGRFYRLYQPEFIVYLTLLLCGSLIAAFYIVGTEKDLLTKEAGIFSWPEAIRHGTFQMVSAQTSTGFATVNYDIWPYFVQVTMIILMFIGGMSGSTAGGVKVIRHYMLSRIAQFKIESLYRAQTVRQFKVQGQEVDNNTMISVLCFFVVVIASATVGILLYVSDGIDLETSLGLVSCMLNNVGMAFRMAGPTESCAFLSNFGLNVSSFLMILGRLEYFVVLAVLSPAFWKKGGGG